MDTPSTGGTLPSSGSAASAPSALPLGTQRYEVTGTLGEGGMGRVLLAKDLQFDRTVALKELRDGSAAAAEARFELEARVTANLEHPGIPPVYERGRTERGPYYVMRRIEGQTLAQAMASRTGPQRLALVPQLAQLAHALGYAHERGVVHRDLKPQNVILGRHGEVMLLDWGLARVLDSAAPTLSAARQDSHETVQGAVMGTPAYMPPEQARGQLDVVGPHTDVFAFGAILYELLTGRPPYGGASSAETLESARAAQYTPVRALAPRAPEALVRLCEDALSTEPTARPANATELARRLDEFLAGALTATASTGARTASLAAAMVGLGVLAVFVARLALQLPGDLGGFVPFWAAGAALLLATVVLCFLEVRTRGQLVLLPVARLLAIGNLLLPLAYLLLSTVQVLEHAREPGFSVREVMLDFRAVAAFALVPVLAALVQFAAVAFTERALTLSRRRD